jgi:outer membrane protein
LVVLIWGAAIATSFGKPGVGRNDGSAKLSMIEDFSEPARPAFLTGSPRTLRQSFEFFDRPATIDRLVTGTSNVTILAGPLRLFNGQTNALTKPAEVSSQLHPMVMPLTFAPNAEGDISPYRGALELRTADRFDDDEPLASLLDRPDLVSQANQSFKGVMRRSPPMTSLLAQSGPVPSGAVTLEAALSSLGGRNPEILGAQGQVRVAREKIVQARAQALPTLSANLGAEGTGTKTSLGLTDQSKTATVLTAGLQIDQTLFNGFRNRNARLAAEEGARLSEANARVSGDAVLLKGVTAYADTLFFRGALTIRKNNLSFMQAQLRAANVRLEIGEGTVSEVALAEAAYQSAAASVSAAESDVSASEASFRSVFQMPPKQLAAVVIPKSRIPRSEADAKARLLASNAQLQASTFAAKKAAAELAFAKGARLPTIKLAASFDKTFEAVQTGSFGLPGVGGKFDSTTKGSVGIKLTIPLFDGGNAGSKLREARAVYDQRILETDQASLLLSAAVETALARYHAAFDGRQRRQKEVLAANEVVGATIDEFQFGDKTILDIVNAQNDMLNAQLLLLEAERNCIVYAYQTLLQIGDMRF